MAEMDFVDIQTGYEFPPSTMNVEKKKLIRLPGPVNIATIDDAKTKTSSAPKGWNIPRDWKDAPAIVPDEKVLTAWEEKQRQKEEAERAKNRIDFSLPTKTGERREKFLKSFDHRQPAQQMRSDHLSNWRTGTTPDQSKAKPVVYLPRV